MEAFQKQSGKSQGIEVLHFEDAEIQKSRADEISFAGFGGLSVLYFKEFNRFFLQLNDWRYPLFRRSIISSSPVEGDSSSRTYVLPAPNGFSYNLKINKVSNSQSFDNLETILDHNSRFSVVGKEIAYRKLDASPELAPRSLHTNPKEIIIETAKKALNTVKNTAATLKSGTKYLTSRKQKVDLGKVQSKNFKKEAKSRIKKDFFESSGKQAKEFLQKRSDNVNLKEKKEFDELRNTTDKQAPSLYICKEELEESIRSTRSIFSYLEPSEKVEEKKGLVTNLRDGARNIRDRVNNFMGRGNQGTPEVQGQSENVSLPEDLGHYQG